MAYHIHLALSFLFLGRDSLAIEWRILLTRPGTVVPVPQFLHFACQRKGGQARLLTFFYEIVLET